MEDVVLHYKSGPDQDVSALIGTTERLLAPFPCRPPQVFSPWFPALVDRHLPLRPARPAPRILSAPDPSPEEEGGKTGPDQDPKQTGPDQDPNQTGPDQDPNQTAPDQDPKQTAPDQDPNQTGPDQDPNQTAPDQDPNQTSPDQDPNQAAPDQDPNQTAPDQDPNQTAPDQDPNQTGPSKNLSRTTEETGPAGSPDPACGVSPQTGLTQGPVNSTNRTVRPRLDQHEVQTETPPDPGLQARTRPGSKPDSPSKRCWTVFRHRVQTKDRTKDQTRVQSQVQTLSRRFLQTLSKLQLHPRQRVKWIIDENNCGDIEQVWRSLSRPLSSLPSSCNAHIVRDQAQIWVYCDLVQSEEVGLRLKEDLGLRGRIRLWERSRGNVYGL